MQKKKVTKARIEQIGEEPFKIRIRLQFQLRGTDGSRAIIDITCHVNIGYRRLPNLSAEKGPGQEESPERNRRWDNYVLVLEKGEAPVNSTLRGPRKKSPAATSSSVKIRRRPHRVRILAWMWSRSRSRIDPSF